MAAYYAMHGYFLLTICYMLHATCDLLLTIDYYFATYLEGTKCYLLLATCYLLLAIYNHVVR